MARANAVVTNEAQDVARELRDQLDSRDVAGLGFVALSTAGGVIIAQEIADRVLPVLGFSRDPTNASGFAVSGALKVVLALLAGSLATATGGMASVVVAFIALGHVVSGGADFFNAIQRTGFLAEAPSMGGATMQVEPSNPSNSNEGATAVSTDGGVEMSTPCGCADAEEKEETAEPRTDGGIDPIEFEDPGNSGATAVSAQF